MVVVDLMHNLFLDSAKHIIKKVWSSCKVLALSSKLEVCEKIQLLLDLADGLLATPVLPPYAKDVWYYYYYPKHA